MCIYSWRPRIGEASCQVHGESRIISIQVPQTGGWQKKYLESSSAVPEPECGRP